MNFRRRNFTDRKKIEEKKMGQESEQTRKSEEKSVLKRAKEFKNNRGNI